MSNLRWRVAANYIKHNKMLAIEQMRNIVQQFIEARTKPTISAFQPYTIFVEPTIRCNLRCPTCDWEARGRGSPDMTLTQFKMILDKLPLVAHIHLEGLGEPLLNKEFLDMVRLAVSRGISVDTTTNCTLVNERTAAELVDSGLMRMFISIDGASAKTYEEARVGASFERVMRHLEILSRAKMRLRSPIEMSLWFVGTNRNMHELSRLVEIASGLNIPMVYVDATHDWGNDAVRARIEPLQVSVEVARKSFESASIRAKKLGVDLRVNAMLARLLNGDITVKCRWPWWSFYITVEGDIVPCCLRPDPQKLSLGNIFRQDFQKVWNGQDYVKFRERIKAGDYPDFCKGCVC